MGVLGRIGGEEVVGRDVEPLGAEVRCDLGAVTDESVVVQVVPVAERAELVILEESVRAECRCPAVVNLVSRQRVSASSKKTIPQEGESKPRRMGG